MHTSIPVLYKPWLGAASPMSNITCIYPYHKVENIRERITYDDVIKWKHFTRYWPFVRGIHRWPVNSPHKAQWRGALMFSLIYTWLNGWVNNREDGDLRCHRAHYDIIVMNIVVVDTLLWQWLQITIVNRMASIQLADEVMWNLAALRVLAHWPLGISN